MIKIFRADEESNKKLTPKQFFDHPYVELFLSEQKPGVWDAFLEIGVEGHEHITKYSYKNTLCWVITSVVKQQRYKIEEFGFNFDVDSFLVIVDAAQSEEKLLKYMKSLTKR